MAPSNNTTSTQLAAPTIAHWNGTLQLHPAMAPRPLSQRWSSPSPPTIVHYNGRLRWQWHPAMTTSTQLVVTPSPYHSRMAPCNGSQQWHHVHSPPPPTIAHYNGNGTQQWHHVHSPKLVVTLPSNHTHYNGTLRCTQQRHTSTAPCNGTLGATSNPPKVVRPPPPLLEVRTPIAIAIWGMMVSDRNLLFHGSIFRYHVRFRGCISIQPFSIHCLILQNISQASILKKPLLGGV